MRSLHLVERLLIGTLYLYHAKRPGGEEKTAESLHVLRQFSVHFVFSVRFRRGILPQPCRKPGKYSDVQVEYNRGIPSRTTSCFVRHSVGAL
jgi:hypothetical protein